jgi:hypothetical protein
MFKQLAFAVCVVVMAPCMALAAQQSVAPNQSPVPAPPSSLNSAAPTSNGSAQSAKPSLAQRLSQSNGTIRPPPVDPGMDKLPPATGTMPVLKPPSNVQSK